MIVRYSMLDSFLRCPQGFHQNYILGKKESQESSALHFGSAMHAALRAHFEDLDPYSVFNMYWGSVREKITIFDRYSWQDLSDMANKTFIPNFIRLHAKKFSNYKVEEELSMPILGEHTLQGTFDFCGDFNGELTMVDWKTAASDYKFSKLEKNPQLYLYAALYRHKYGVLPKGIMYKVFVKSKGSIQTLYRALTEDILNLHMENVSSIIRNMLQVIKSGDYYSNYNCYCEQCFKEKK